MTPPRSELFFLDMVHHNPGEAPFTTPFTQPAHLAALGYNGQVAKHLNACVDFNAFVPGSFPVTPEETHWLAAASAQRDAELAAAAQAGLAMYYHIDLCLLPRRVIELLGMDICDVAGRVDLTRPATQELHRQLLAAMFARYPTVAGLVVRIGETYLFDTPYHGGNTAVPLHDPSVSRPEQMRRFTLLIELLREEVCVRHGKQLIYRTWDYFGDRFHAAPDFYLTVTDAIAPHPLLVFSIKHTAGDFFSGCQPNPCLGLGRHRQIVEVQCQREYEGKGAFPSYVARGVIEGFTEVPAPQGLREWVRTPQFAGLWTWSRGGGWFGPYLQHEFWCELNVRVLAAWQKSPDQSEEALFAQVCAEHYGLDDTGTRRLRELCLLAPEALWLGRSFPALARHRQFSDADSARLWLRDDRLGGLDQLGGLLADLHGAGLLAESVAEKERAAALYDRIAALAEELTFPDASTQAAVRTSAEYGRRLFAFIAVAWPLLIQRWQQQPLPADALANYHRRWAAYRELPSTHPLCASLFQADYWNWPGQPAAPGLDASVVGSSPAIPRPTATT